MVPTAPGLGVELIEENFSKYPYPPTDVPLFDGTINFASVAEGDAVLACKKPRRGGA